MALRISCQRAAKRATSITPATSVLSSYSAQWRRGNATVAPTQVTPGAKGPTAMVFMNMGGPSTTDEVHGFLSMLFVRNSIGTHHRSSADGL
ncbi:Ferrochelatase [Alternaria alternata]|nr:Ferrochelatase [Alternaria alternata]